MIKLFLQLSLFFSTVVFYQNCSYNSYETLTQADMKTAPKERVPASNTDAIKSKVNLPFLNK